MSSEQVADAARNARPPQFTLAKLLGFMVGLGIVLAVVRGFGLLAGAALAGTAVAILLLPWPQLPKRMLPRVLLVAGMGLGTWLLGVFSPVVVTVIVGFLLARFRLGLLALYVVLAPFGPNYAHGIIDYCRGQARLRATLDKHFPGTFDVELKNLDPQWRCQWAWSSDKGDGYEWMYEDPYNFAVQSMITTFGYMPGSYTGPYPSWGEAYAAVGQATAISVTDLQRDKILLGETEYALAPGVGKEIAKEAQQWSVGTPAPPGQSVSTKAILWREECLIIDFSPTVFPTSGVPVIILISRESGRPFAWQVMRNY